jgi:hypothetical protein
MNLNNLPLYNEEYSDDYTDRDVNPHIVEVPSPGSDSHTKGDEAGPANYEEHEEDGDYKRSE